MSKAREVAEAFLNSGKGNRTMKIPLILIALLVSSNVVADNNCDSRYETDNELMRIYDRETGLSWNTCVTGYKFNPASSNCEGTYRRSSGWMYADYLERTGSKAGDSPTQPIGTGLKNLFLNSFRPSTRDENVVRVPSAKELDLSISPCINYLRNNNVFPLHHTFYKHSEGTKPKNIFIEGNGIFILTRSKMKGFDQFSLYLTDKGGYIPQHMRKPILDVSGPIQD